MKQKTDLRKVFVQLLFSLAIGQVALRIGDLVSVNADIANYFYSYSHLALSVFIITTSWVGWHNSKSTLIEDNINNVISWQYLVLLVDLFLVITYFIIVKGAETPIDHNIESIPNASSYIECFWTVIIFITYLFWDVLTKTFDFTYIYNGELQKFRRGREFQGKHLYQRLKPTLWCTAFSFLIFFLMSNETEENRVLITDLSLIFLFFTFRGMKQEIKKEYKLHKEQLTSKYSEEIKKQIVEVEFPIMVEENTTIYHLKYLIIKRVPIFLLLLSISYYIFLIHK